MLDTAHHPRLLVVVSADFGDLVQAVALAWRQPLRVTLLLPARLWAMNKQLAWVDVLPYDSPADIITAMRSIKPALTLLACGYLFSLQRAVPIDAAQQIVTTAGQNQLPLATTDVFLGLAGEIGGELLSPVLQQRQLIVEHVSTAHRALRALPQVYFGQAPAPASAEATVEAMVDPSVKAPGAVVSMAWCNPELVHGDARQAVAPPLGMHRPHWLFVLSAEDSGQLSQRLGIPGLLEMLSRRLTEAHRADRVGVLVAAAPVVYALRGRVPADVQLLEFCPLMDLLSLAVYAEHAFYWNWLSSSLLWRLPRGRSVFFLDRGHMATAMPRLIDRAIDCYFGGAAPITLTDEQPLNPARLSELADLQHQQLAPARAICAAAMSPLELVKRLGRLEALS